MLNMELFKIKKFILLDENCKRYLKLDALVVSIWMLHVYGTKYPGMAQVKCFKGCLPQILLGSFLNTLSHIISKR